jgi:hypothetical protein
MRFSKEGLCPVAELLSFSVEIFSCLSRETFAHSFCSRPLSVFKKNL